METNKYPPRTARWAGSRDLVMDATNDIDFALLDYKSVDDFIYIQKSKADNHTIVTHLAKQLKASRSLMNLTQCLTIQNNPEDIMNRFVESACAIIDAERVFLLVLDTDSGQLVGLLKNSTGSLEPFYLSSGVECRFSHLLLCQYLH